MEAESSLVRAMRSRISRHMLFSGGTLLLVIPLELAVGQVLRTRALFAIPILLVPIVGFVSTLKYLRCPACEKMVAWQVSGHYAVLGRLPPRQCLHCGAEIFGDPRVTRRRMKYLVVGVMVAAFVLSLIGTLGDCHPRGT